ncbi:MAG: CapA family protein [Chloroflexaceae bacterium]
MARPIPLVLLLLTLLVALPPGGAARAQRADGLDQPLLAANLCGSGAGSEIHFTIAATGDTFPHENIQAVGESQGYDVLFDAVRPFLQAADLAYTNFDGAILEGSPISGYPLFNFNPALATALRNAGIDVVSTANNHILDRGPEGIDATLRVLEANGILQHGTALMGAVRPPYLPLTITRDGVSLTIGFISATWGTNGISDPHGQVNLLYESTEYGQQGGVRQSLLDAIAQADRETDLVLVAAHFGFEYEFYPHESQIDAVRRMAEAGADVILGAQSHTLQPVDILDVGGRRTLVIYLLANFLASQGAFQASAYAATSVIFYVGLARGADGQVRMTGYRYLPIMHIDNDTRPAPIQPGSADDVIAHVRTIMRDPGGLRQVSPTPPASGAIIPVCPPITLAETPATPISGDFAQHYATLGGTVPRPLTDALAVLGLPLGPAVIEPAGDCATPVPVLYTERQRLELHAAEPWPFRVSGSLLGVESFTRRYPGVALQPRTDLAAADAFADPRFRAFYEQFGGLAIFGYPISGPLSEEHPETGAPMTVQYFERARFEAAPDALPDAPLTAQVRLGLLGSELLAAGGAARLCPGAPATDLSAAAETSFAGWTGGEAPHSAPEDGRGWLGSLFDQRFNRTGWWLPILALAALLVVLVTLVGFAVADWRSFRRHGARRRAYRRRRSAFERLGQAPMQPAPDRATRESRTTAYTGTTVRRAMPPAPPDDDDALLRRLLEE